MKLSFGISNERVSISLGEGNTLRLQADPMADQSQPKVSYVYAHIDERQIPFYIGIGVGQRAWSKDRHPLWHRYVEKHLQGKYSVVILKDNLSPEQAEEMESAWIAQETETLVNWVNMSRPTDFDALDHYHKLRDANLAAIAVAKSKEKANPDVAVEMYLQSLGRLAQYAHIQADLGLVGQLLDEVALETGIRGELQILDRLTLCLIRLGRGSEAQAAVSEYFEKYRADLTLTGAASILKRVSKANVSKGV